MSIAPDPDLGTGQGQSCTAGRVRPGSLSSPYARCTFWYGRVPGTASCGVCLVADSVVSGPRCNQNGWGHGPRKHSDGVERCVQEPVLTHFQSIPPNVLRVKRSGGFLPTYQLVDSVVLAAWGEAVHAIPYPRGSGTRLPRHLTILVLSEDRNSGLAGLNPTLRCTN